MWQHSPPLKTWAWVGSRVAPLHRQDAKAHSFLLWFVYTLFEVQTFEVLYAGLTCVSRRYYNITELYHIMFDTCLVISAARMYVRLQRMRVFAHTLTGPDRPRPNRILHT